MPTYRHVEFPTHCDRCGAKLVASTMSKFNTDQICLDCKDDEKKAPGYAEADRREVEMVRAGVFDFAGVGLSGEDRDFLAARRRARRTT